MATTTAPEAVSPRLPLWLATLAPSIWMTHFLVSYGTTALWCGRHGDARAAGLPLVLALYTAVGVAAAGACLELARRRWRRLGAAPAAEDTPVRRTQFVTLVALVLSAISISGMVFVAGSVALVGTCR